MSSSCLSLDTLTTVLVQFLFLSVTGATDQHSYQVPSYLVSNYETVSWNDASEQTLSVPKAKFYLRRPTLFDSGQRITFANSDLYHSLQPDPTRSHHGVYCPFSLYYNPQTGMGNPCYQDTYRTSPPLMVHLMRRIFA